jgi:hypothetical protein
LRRPSRAAGDFAGSYRNAGEIVIKLKDWHENKPHTRIDLGRAYFTFEFAGDSRQRVDYEQASAATVEVKVLEKGRVELIARSESAIVPAVSTLLEE